MCVTKYYVTGSTNALHALSGVRPLQLHAEIDKDLTGEGVGIRVFIVPEKTIKLWKKVPNQEDICRIAWTSHLIPYLYYTFGFKQLDKSIGFAFLVV